MWEYSFAIPNGLRIAGNAATRGRLMASAKRKGLRPGVSDLFIGYPNGVFHGLFLELKAKDGRVSDEQDDFILKMSEQGYKCVVAKSYDGAIAEIEHYVCDVV